MKEAVKKIISLLKKAKTKLKKTDWSQPKNVLFLVAIVILPFIGWYYVSTGFVIGLMMSVSILWLLEKSPYPIQWLVAKFPLLSDLLLSTLVIALFGEYFGSGLILGISAVFAALILSWALHSHAEHFNEKYSASTA